jgi:hypothetical protein
MQSPVIFGIVADRYLATHDKPLAEVYPACWEFTVGIWHFAMNGHREPRLGGPHDGMRGDVPPFTVGVWCNGWLAGHVGPYDGVLVNVNEDEVVAALRAEQLTAGV